MTPTSTPLASAFGTLRATARGEQGESRLLAAIMALLAHIFARLEPPMPRRQNLDHIYRAAFSQYCRGVSIPELSKLFQISKPKLNMRFRELVVGVIDPEGRPVAFTADRARAALAAGDAVALAGVELVADGGGLRARSSGGAELPAHQAFWFAWSQFHPDTALWTGR